MNDDEMWMDLAFQEAKKGIGKTSPNPAVGAVLVKNGLLLGKGWHRKAGQPHAEREAIADAASRYGIEALCGATAYVTLEPCSTHGRTPPCVSGLIDCGVVRVVYACQDPNPAHAGRADALLMQKGIEVVKGVRMKECESLLRAFTKVQKTGLPWVIVKMAMSLDGRITRPKHEGQWLTGVDAREDVQKLRSQVDAIVTSGATVRADRPALTIRHPDLLEGRSQPWRAIFTRNENSLPADAPLFTDETRERTLILSGDIEVALRDLVAERGVSSLMVEAGGELVAEFFRLSLVDECVIYMAPMITGGLPSVAGITDLNVRMKDANWERVGDDLKVRLLVDRNQSGK
jgi:diaminohydroxyphosphoribosylaminopyrimidine deaminase/5-amino-6-(5-phosphoribosylamino)uracil reductase